ncbi:MAG: Sugar ABC transporter, ATP-binding protein, partial [Thermotoga sp. 47_83]
VQTDRGELVKVFGDPAKIPSVGEKVFLVPHLEKIHLFNPETEETIL